VKKGKRKRKSEPKEFTPEVKTKVDEAIRIRTRMRVRDLSGQPKLFRSTVAKNPESVEDEQETEGDSE
jgi:hypothetical protein